VWDWKEGDEVFFTPDIFKSPGTFAQYCSVPQFYLARKPASLSFETGNISDYFLQTSILAAGMPYSALTAWQCIKNVNNGEIVCIFGAGGGVGWFLLNILKHIKNCTVTAVCHPKDFEKVPEN
jgi:NADPH:quinone reductase-like Zn-dependent oxidoreductase